MSNQKIHVVFQMVLSLAMAVAVAGGAHAQPTGVAPPVAPLSAPAPAPSKTGADAQYILGPEDTIEVEVVGRPDRARAKIYADGTVQLNLVGKVTAAGKTTRQLGEELAQALKTGGFYANPVINIEVVNFASRYVTVLGAVGSPGLVPIDRPYRLSEILARVGGVRDNGADYVTVRPEKGDESRYSVKALATGDATQDPYVQPGDKIFSPVADLFYISGQIVSPGAYPLSSDLTLSQAIARGGGLSASGSDKRVQITRKGVKTKVDLSSKIEPGDVIVVGERLF